MLHRNHLQTCQPSRNDGTWSLPVEDTSPMALPERFIREAHALGCVVRSFSDTQQAAEHVLNLIAPDTSIQSWDPAHIPLPGLADALASVGIRITPSSAACRIGLTGAAAALAGTGSLILTAGPGRPRQASLVPAIHIAVITSEQILPDFDTWVATQHTNDYQDFRSSRNIMVISGPSRTGDIANILVRGVHGPKTLHIIIV
jgi:hypothetical protein